MFSASSIKKLFNTLSASGSKRSKSEVATPAASHLQTNVSDEVYYDIFNREVHDAEAQFYPPKVNGLSVFCVDAILKRYSEHIEALHEYAGIGLHRRTKDGDNLFTERYVKTIRRLAEYVHMLPASEYHHHSQPGGLFRHSLDAALIALRKADNQLPPTVNKVDLDSQRRVRYLYAAWLGALLHDTGKILTDMQVSAYTVYDKENNISVPATKWKKSIKPWIPQIETLISWATRNQVERYFVHFKSSRIHKRHVSSGAVLLPHIAKGEGLEFIMDSPDDLYGNLIAALNGYAQINDYLATAIRYGDSVSTAKDVKTMATAAFGSLKKSRMLSIVDTMRSLKKDWLFNTDKSHAFVVGDCVFLRWQSAFHSILKSAMASKFDALPSDTTSLLGMMEDFRIVEPFDSENRFALFAIGKFSEEDVLDIAQGKTSVKWIELIKVVYREWVYDSDPIHPNIEGLLFLSTTSKYFITKENGSITEISFDNAISNKELDQKEVEATNELQDSISISEEKQRISANMTEKKRSSGKTKTEKPSEKEAHVDSANTEKNIKEADTEPHPKAQDVSNKKEKKLNKPKKPTKSNAPVMEFDNRPTSTSNTVSNSNNETTEQSDKDVKDDNNPTPSKQIGNTQPASHSYIKQINHTWYIDVDKYTEYHNCEAAEAGNELYKNNFIRKKLGSSSISTLIKTKDGKSIVCFELTPAGREELMNENPITTGKDNPANESPKATTKNKAINENRSLVSESKPKATCKQSKDTASQQDVLPYEFSQTSYEGTLGALLLKHKIKVIPVKGRDGYISINLRALSMATGTKRSIINGMRISKLISVLQNEYDNDVEIEDMRTFTINAATQDISQKGVFK